MAILAPGATTGLESFGRFVAPAFPLALLIAEEGEAHPAALAACIAVAAVVQGLVLFLYLHGQWIT